MSETPDQDWNPRDPSILQNQRHAYDHMREHCPVAFSDYAQWSVFRHQDVKRILMDHSCFSNKVSAHYLSVPNGMDPPQHSPYRTIIEPYFSDERMAAFKPECQAIAAELVENIIQNDTTGSIDIMPALGEPFALRIQCAFMGWPQSLQGTLLDWAKRNNQATLARDRTLLKQYAAEFEDLIATLLEARRTASTDLQDVTAQLMNEQVNGKPLSTAEIASLLRNWTVGEVGTIAASVGIIVQFLAAHSELQQQLREKPEGLWYANDEILRMHNPLTDNRRRTTCPVELHGRQIPAESRITLNWVAANRDPRAFEKPDEFAWGRDESSNLLYGAGVHICPGAPLARMELVVVIRSLLQNTKNIELATDQPAVFATYPASGYASLPVKITPR